MVDITKDLETVDSEPEEDVTPLDEKLLREGLQLSVRPRKTSLREDKLLHRISLSNRKLNSSQILKQSTLTSNVSVCPRTVRERLLEIGLRGCNACPKPLLTEFQRKRRLMWLSVSEAHNKVHDKSDGMGLHVFSHSVGRLHIVSGTVKAMDYIEVLQNKLLLTARDLFGNQSRIFQDDIAPCHRAKVVQKGLKYHTVNRMNWPRQSPDLNPIENLWFKIGYEISKKKTFKQT
ncbi:uncharacterized protein TNCV_1782501 [Trichonephila clavipes]|nr:uncharacterized protein TNCV_1782501 [Trichonephila clavipes]